MDLTLIGETNYRNTKQKFGIKDRDRLGHIYAIGKTGVGKSTLLKNMALSDIERGNGICILDPHSDVATELIQKIPEGRKEDLVYFNPKDIKNAIAFNPIKGIHPNYHHLVASGLIATFKKIWSDSWGPRMEHILRYTILTLLTVPDATLLDIQQLLTNIEFREKCLKYITEEYLLDFWQMEFALYSKNFKAEVISPILNKVGIFRASAPLRATIGQKTRGIRLQEIMDKRKILICNFSKGELGEDASSLLGCIILTSIQYASMVRAKQDPDKRVPFYVYVDEMQSYATLSFLNLLSEGRKFGISLFLTNQYIEQLDERIRAAIFGNAGTIISFRVGVSDAEFLAKEFYPVFQPTDFMNLPRHSIYIKLMVDGTATQPFSALTLKSA